MTYRFDEKLHAHTLDGKPLQGVTTVLSVISKPALIQWAANMAVDYLQEHWGKDGTDNWEQLCKEARTAHRRKKEKAGDWGTLLHKAIEEYIKNKTITSLDEKGITAFNHFRAWALENKVEFLESEKHVWSKAEWVGGILDMIAIVNGKKMICDIKTSSGIYPEMWAQMGAYHLCLEDMGEHEDIQGYMIINLKKTGEIDLGLSENTTFNKDYFRAILQVYKLKQIADESIATRRDV